MMTVRGLFIFCVGFIVTGVSTAYTQTAVPSETVDLAYYRTYVNRENCSKDQRHYLACISSLQVLIASLDPKLNLKTQTTGADLLGLHKTKLALNAGNLQILAGKTEESNLDLNVSMLKQVFLRNRQTKADFRRDFEPAYYHFKVASNDVIADVLEYLGTAYASKLKEDDWVSAINEYMHISLDPHSDWRVIEDTAKEVSSKEQEFVGLGIRYIESPLGALIETVVKGTGADAAGLKADDTIMTVNGQQMKGLGREMISAAIRGEEGGSLNLRVLRGGQTLEITATRKKIVTPVVTDSILRTNTQTIGMVRLENFTYENACGEVSKVLKGFNEAKVDQVLLDLRGNGGGAVSIAECISGLFLGPEKTIAYSNGRGMQAFLPASAGTPLERAKKMNKDAIELFLEEAGDNLNDPVYQDYLQALRSPEAITRLARAIELYDYELSDMTSSGEQVYSGKLAVLVDGGSASASEMVAGAFRDLNRALIVGQTTFGKGSYQASAARHGRFQRWQTGGLFFQPSGLTNQTVGVKPHIEVYRGLEPTVVELYQMREKERFLFPLEPKNVRHVVHNADEMDKLVAPTECLRTKNVKAAYAGVSEPQWKDMQVLTAVAALGCMQ